MNVTLALVLSDNDICLRSLLASVNVTSEVQYVKDKALNNSLHKTMKLEAIVNHETFRIHTTCIVVSRAQAQLIHIAQTSLTPQTCHVALCCTLLCCTVLNSLLSIQNIIIFVIDNKEFR